MKRSISVGRLSAGGKDGPDSKERKSGGTSHRSDPSPSTSMNRASAQASDDGSSLPDSVRGVPEDLRPAIRRKQNKQSAMRSRQKKQQMMTRMSSALTILTAKVERLERRTEAIEKSLLPLPPSSPTRQRSSAAADPSPQGVEADPANRATAADDDGVGQDSGWERLKEGFNLPCKSASSDNDDSEDDDDDAIEQLIDQCLAHSGTSPYQR